MTVIQHEFAYPKLMEARKAKRMTRTDLAFALACTPEAVTTWESGKVTPPIKRLFAICRVLEIDIHDLFEETSGD